MFKYAVIYAGGAGTRMLPLTQYIPKALIEINNTPLIDYAINFLRKNKIKHIYVTYAYKSEQILTYLKNKVEGFINTTNKDNSYFLYNSFIKEIDEPVVCMPCDIIVNLNLKQVYTEYKKNNYPAHCIIPVKTNKNISGDYITEQSGIITRLDRKKETNKYACGIQIINPKQVNELTRACNNFNKVWQQLIALKQLYVLNVEPKTWRAYDNIQNLI